jgi:hypothetical protein
MLGVWGLLGGHWPHAAQLDLDHPAYKLLMAACIVVGQHMPLALQCLYGCTWCVCVQVVFKLCSLRSLCPNQLLAVLRVGAEPLLSQVAWYYVFLI